MASDNQIQELYEKILNAYESKINENASVQSFLASLNSGKATSEGVSKYASDIGECAAEALDKYLEPEYLPDGRLTWEILSETVEPLFHVVFDSVMEAASIVTRQEDAKQGIHLNPIIPEYPTERVHALMNSMLRRYDPENAK